MISSLKIKLMLKAVLFDMDGVIVDTEPLHHKAYQQMFEKMGIEVSEAMYNGFTGQSTRSICMQLCRFFNLKNNPEELVQIKRNNFTKLFFEDDAVFLATILAAGAALLPEESSEDTSLQSASRS